MIENLLRTIAQAAGERRPLPPALRAIGDPTADAVADRLDAGATLPAALGDAIGPELADLLAGPRPSTAEAALLAAEWVRLRRADRIAMLARLTHPACGLAVVAIAVALTSAAAQAPHAGWLAATGVALAGGLLLACSGERLARLAPSLGAAAVHARLAGSYERAALVARWRLPEESLVPLLGPDLPRLAPVLADPLAEDHCRRLAAYHRAAELRARQRLWWLVMALGYIAGGCLLLAAGVPMIEGWTQLFAAEP